MRLVLSLLSVLVLAGCGGGTAATSRGAAETGITRVSLPTPTPSPVPKQSPPVAPEVMAEQYIRALFAGDQATQRRLFPDSQPDPERDEPRVELVRLQAAPLTREEANDNDPLSTWHYARVVADVRYQDRVGQWTYQIGFRPNRKLGGQLRIVMVSRIGGWQ